MVNEPLTKDKIIMSCSCKKCPPEACWWIKETMEGYVKLNDVASAVRLLREKIDKNLSKEMRRLFRIEKKYEKKGDKVNARNYRHCGMTLGINAKREVRKAIDEVFGGVEGK